MDLKIETTVFKPKGWEVDCSDPGLWYKAPAIDLEVEEIGPAGVVGYEPCDMIGKIKMSDRYREVSLIERTSVKYLEEEPNLIGGVSYEYEAEIFDKSNGKRKRYKLVEIE